MLTTRDFEIVDFLKEFKVADTTTIASLFFTSLSACQKRLKVMSDNNVIHRYRDNVTNQYIYFIKKPAHLKHSLLTTKFYATLKKHTQVEKFAVEPNFKDIRPDASFLYMVNNKKCIGVLEVEISHKGFDWRKYDKFIANRYFENFMTIAPTLYIVSDLVKTNPKATYNYKIFDTSFSNFEVV